VLQRIAICYLAAAAIYRWTSGRRGAQPLVIAAVAVSLALVYWAVMTFVPVPGGFAGDLSPEGNLGAWLDRALMDGHLWRPRWDPEGLLSTIPAISTTLLGILAGLVLTSERSSDRKAALLAVGGATGIVIGYAWHPVFPINKNLWTSSYAIFTAGAASMLLAACYWIIDVKGWKRWTTPLVVLGVNAITLFVASGLLVKTLSVIRVAGPDGRDIALSSWMYLHWFVPLADPKNASLLYALANLAVLFALLGWMYRRRIILKV
jgi:predicted acyltransferase